MERAIEYHLQILGSITHFQQPRFILDWKGNINWKNSGLLVEYEISNSSLFYKDSALSWTHVTAMEVFLRWPRVPEFLLVWWRSCVTFARLPSALCLHMNDHPGGRDSFLTSIILLHLTHCWHLYCLGHWGGEGGAHPLLKPTYTLNLLPSLVIGAEGNAYEVILLELKTVITFLFPSYWFPSAYSASYSQGYWVQMVRMRTDSVLMWLLLWPPFTQEGGRSNL